MATLFHKTEKEQTGQGDSDSHEEPKVRTFESPTQIETALSETQHTPEPLAPGNIPGVRPEQYTDQVTQEQPVPQQEHQQAGVSHAGSKAAAAVQQSTPTPQPKTEERKKIESILAEGLTQMYQSMTPEEQARFRAKGEETASAIEIMMRVFKATAHRVLELIRQWLGTIPRVNGFFLEQESKLKTDEVMKLQREEKKQKRATHIHST